MVGWLVCWLVGVVACIWVVALLLLLFILLFSLAVLPHDLGYFSFYSGDAMRCAVNVLALFSSLAGLCLVVTPYWLFCSCCCFLAVCLVFLLLSIAWRDGLCSKEALQKTTEDPRPKCRCFFYKHGFSQISNLAQYRL